MFIFGIGLSIMYTTLLILSIANGPLIPSPKILRSDDGCYNSSNIKSYCSSFMYILVSLDYNAGFVLFLYRIDALHHLQHNNSTHNLYDLDPLLFFPNTGPERQPSFLNCIKFGSKFYFFGLDP